MSAVGYSLLARNTVSSRLERHSVLRVPSRRPPTPAERTTARLPRPRCQQNCPVGNHHPCSSAPLHTRASAGAPRTPTSTNCSVFQYRFGQVICQVFICRGAAAAFNRLVRRPTGRVLYTSLLQYFPMNCIQVMVQS